MREPSQRVNASRVLSRSQELGNHTISSIIYFSLLATPPGFTLFVCLICRWFATNGLCCKLFLALACQTAVPIHQQVFLEIAVNSFLSYPFPPGLFSACLSRFLLLVLNKWLALQILLSPGVLDRSTYSPTSVSWLYGLQDASGG